jgi:transposase-like protein
MLGGELTHHLGDPAGGEKPRETTNQRNGTSGKTVLTDDGPLSIEVPRAREGTFEPRIPKHERRCTGFNDKILALNARGMTVREIQAFSRRCTRWRCRLTARHSVLRVSAGDLYEDRFTALKA